MKKRSAKLFIFTVIVAVAAILCTNLTNNTIGIKTAEAAAKKDTVDIRIIGTTDLHGQLNSMDYELGVDYSIGGLARVYDLIEGAREEKPVENTVTLDAGDVLYDYTTEYIFAEKQSEIQPIYKAMAKIGYDAITLGNHDFDYGYDYILKQLDGSGLRNITVVSNVTDSKNGDHPFLENKIITRKMRTSSGKTVEVKIGIIGQTLPILSSKTHSYVGILKVDDIVENAKVEAKKLKDAGADVIIALSHTGMGPENPEPFYKDEAYALTLIPDIDVVVCGHEHNLFPDTNKSNPYYNLPNVNKKTSLVNGKNVIMAGDRGEAIGVVDLVLDVSDKSYDIIDRSSEVRLVNGSDTTENKEIASMYGNWTDKLLEHSTDIIGKLEDGELIQNYFGLVGDNSAIQLLNDTKIHYGLKFVNSKGTKYKDYPIIATSTYSSFGLASIQDYVNIHGDIKESSLSLLEPYNNYLYIYKITGKQLKEWLEWSASAYETQEGNTVWTDKTMSQLMEEYNLKSLIKEEWLNDWSTFCIFDGIDYVVDPSIGPRYDMKGTKISDHRRVDSVTYNGTRVSDDMVFVLVCDKITKPTDANNGVEKQVLLNGFNRDQSYLSKYIEQQSKTGNILPQLDYNWKVRNLDGYNFIIKTPDYADSLFKKTKWYQKFLAEKDQYRYYAASYTWQGSDTTGPHIVIAPMKSEITRTSYEVGVSVTDQSKIKTIRYTMGNYGTDFEGWYNVSELTDRSFTVYQNATYTVYAEDIYGNKSVQQLVVDNINKELLGKPVIGNYSNRLSTISGTAEPQTTIVFEAYTGTYESKVSPSGKFSYALPAQPSGTEIKVFVKDTVSKTESEPVIVKVKRTGPNQPKINEIRNDTDCITGNKNDDDATIIAIIGDRVYVPKGCAELYKKCTDLYNPNYFVIETNYKSYDTGFFKLSVPIQPSGYNVSVYSIDHVYRRSRPNDTVVEDVGPNAPVVYEVSNIERTISGYVPALKNTVFNVTLKLGKKTYTTKTNKSGAFSFDFDDQLHAGDILTVYTTDSKDGITRTSFKREIVVHDIEEYIKKASSNLTLEEITSKSYNILGTYLESDTVNIAVCHGTGNKFKSYLYTVKTDEYGNYIIDLTKNLPAGVKIYAMARFSDGKILDAKKTVVLPGIPDKPSLFLDITNSTKFAQVVTDKGCEVTVKIGEDIYKSSKYEYNKEFDIYYYTIPITRANSGTEVTIIAKNSAGTSDVYTTKLIKAAPDTPNVNTVKAKDKKITGTIELFTYYDETKEGTVAPDNEEIPDTFKDAPIKVAETQTQVFAQIGNQVYEGKISNRGYFIIEIPTMKAGTEILVWGTNKSGRGPLAKVKVVSGE